MNELPRDATEPAAGPASGAAVPPAIPLDVSAPTAPAAVPTPPFPESLPEPPPVPQPGIAAGRALLIVVAYVAVQIAVGVAVGLLVGMYYAAAMHGAPARDVLAAAQRAVVMPAAALSVLAAGLVAFDMTRRALPGPVLGGALRPVGWARARGADIALAAFAGVAIGALYLLVLRPLFPPAPGQTFGPVAQALSAGGWQRIVWAVLALAVAPPVEEFLFRGVLWTGLARATRAGLAAVVVTLSFTVLHATEARAYWPAWAVISAVGLGAIWLRVRSRSLVPPIVFHASYNACLVAVVFLAAA